MVALCAAAEPGLALVFLCLASEVSRDSLLAWMLLVLCWLLRRTLLTEGSGHFLLRTTGVERPDLRLAEGIML